MCTFTVILIKNPWDFIVLEFNKVTNIIFAREKWGQKCLGSGIKGSDLRWPSSKCFIEAWWFKLCNSAASQENKGKSPKPDPNIFTAWQRHYFKKQGRGAYSTW